MKSFTNLFSERKLDINTIDNSIISPQPSLAEVAQWAYTHIYSQPYVDESVGQNKKINRYFHGIQHVTRVSLYVAVLARFREQNCYRIHIRAPAKWQNPR